MPESRPSKDVGAPSKKGGRPPQPPEKIAPRELTRKLRETAPKPVSAALELKKTRWREREPKPEATEKKIQLPTEKNRAPDPTGKKLEEYFIPPPLNPSEGQPPVPHRPWIKALPAEPAPLFTRGVLALFAVAATGAGIIGTVVALNVFSGSRGERDPALGPLAPPPPAAATQATALGPAPLPEPLAPERGGLDPDQELIEKYRSRLGELLTEGRGRPVRRLFEQALAERSKNPAFWVGMGDAYAQVLAQAGEMSRPEIHKIIAPFFENALTAGSGDARVLGRLGAFFVESGQLVRAVEVLRKAHRMDPGADAVRQNLLFALVATHEREEAIEVARDWVLRQPENIRVRTALANLYLEVDDSARAINHLRILVRLDADNSSHPGLLLRLLYEEARYAEAAEVFEQAVRIAPGNRELRYALALAYCGQERWGDARREFETLLTMAGEPAGFNAAFYGNFAVAMAHENESEEAERLYRKAVEMDPDSADHRNNLAFLLIQEGRDLVEAEALVRAVRTARPEFGPFHDTEGCLRLARGDAAGALESFRAAIEASVPPTAVMFMHLGDAHAALGDRPAARAAWARGLELKPEDAELQARLAP